MVADLISGLMLPWLLPARKSDITSVDRLGLPTRNGHEVLRDKI